MDLRSTYNKIAEDWVKDHDQDTWWQAGTDMFLSLLPKNASVLDVGCGGGIKTRYMADRGYRVAGVDFSDKMIEIAQRVLPGLSFQVLDMYRLSEYLQKVDGIFAQAVLLHIPKSDVQNVLKQMYAILNPGGLLYIAVKGMRHNGLEEEIKREDDYGYEYERFFSYFTLGELKKHFVELGLEIAWELDTPSGKTNWIQVVGRKMEE